MVSTVVEITNTLWQKDIIKYYIKIIIIYYNTILPSGRLTTLTISMVKNYSTSDFPQSISK